MKSSSICTFCTTVMWSKACYFLRGDCGIFLPFDAARLFLRVCTSVMIWEGYWMIGGEPGLTRGSLSTVSLSVICDWRQKSLATLSLRVPLVPTRAVSNVRWKSFWFRVIWLASGSMITWRWTREVETRPVSGEPSSFAALSYDLDDSQPISYCAMSLVFRDILRSSSSPSFGDPPFGWTCRRSSCIESTFILS